MAAAWTPSHTPSSDLEKKLFEKVRAATPHWITQGPVFDPSKKGMFTWVITRAQLEPYDPQNNPQGLGLKKWLAAYKKEAQASTAGIRGIQNILYPWDSRYPIHMGGLALATFAKAQVALRTYPGMSLHKILAGEVRYNSVLFEQIIARVQAACGITTHVPLEWRTLPVWMVSFLVFFYDLVGGEHVTASHAISQKTATKDINNQGSQYLVAESLAFVAEMQRIIQEVEQKGEFTLSFADINDYRITSDFMEQIDDGVIPYVQFLKTSVAHENNISCINAGTHQVVISCTHGSMFRTMEKIMRRLGVSSRIRWIHTQEDPFFGGIGKIVRLNKEGALEMFDYSCDATIMEMDPKTQRISFPVIQTMHLEEHLKDAPLGTMVLNTDPDGDRLVAMQVQSAETIPALVQQGIAYVTLDDKRVISVYTPNQFFLMCMDFQKHSLLERGTWNAFPRCMIKTTPSSASWDQWAAANQVKVVNIPVGFKHIAAILQKIEAQIAHAPYEPVRIKDIFGNTIELGIMPRLLFAGEESGGMIVGPEEYITTQNGRKAIAMREKSACEAMIIALAMQGFLDQRDMLLSDYLAQIYEENKISLRFDMREDVVYYNEAEPDIAKLLKAKEQGEQVRTRVDTFYLALVVAWKEKKISLAQVHAILEQTFQGLCFKNLDQLFFVGDGTYLVFSDKIIEIRPSGTDAKTKIYCSAQESKEAIRYVKALGTFQGEQGVLYTQAIADEVYQRAPQTCKEWYTRWDEEGLHAKKYEPPQDDAYMQGEDALRVDVTGMYAPDRVTGEAYQTFLDSEIMRRSIKIDEQIQDTDRFGPESKKGGLFGHALCQDRETIAQWIWDRKVQFGSSCLWHCGIGGQALGNRGLLESCEIAQGLKVYVMEKIGYPMEELLRDAIAQGHQATHMLIHVSSKSGTTDETMINFQEACVCLMRALARELGIEGKKAAALIEKYQGAQDISNVTSADLRLDEEEKMLLTALWERIIITTTLDAAQSRLYAMARGALAKEIMGPGGIACFQIPNNIGGRFSERSLSGDVTGVFAGMDIFALNEGGRRVLEVYTGRDPRTNPALCAAVLLYLYNPDYMVIAVPDNRQLAKAAALAQKFPESWGKDGKGPFVITVAGVEALRAHIPTKGRKVYLVIETDHCCLQDEVKEQPHIVYQQRGLKAEEEGMRLGFFDALTKWYGILNAAECTDTITSQEYERRDWQKQPFVELAKKILTKTAAGVSRDRSAVNTSYHTLLQQVQAGPYLKRGYDSESVPEAQALLVDAQKKIGQISAHGEREHVSVILEKIKEIRKERMDASFARVQALDAEEYAWYMQLMDVGREPQQWQEENVAEELAKIMYSHLLHGRICVPVFYTPAEEAEILGTWYKYVCAKAGILAEYGIGTREQHSYFQSLLDGKYVVYTLLVDSVRTGEEVFSTQRPIASYGLAKSYLQGLYPDQVCRLFLEAEADAFAQVKRGCAILRLFDISTQEGLSSAFRLFGRAVALTSAMMRTSL